MFSLFKSPLGTFLFNIFVMILLFTVFLGAVYCFLGLIDKITRLNNILKVFDIDLLPGPVM